MREISVGNNLTAGVKTTVYTVPTGYYAKWVLCHVFNATASSKNVTIYWYDASTSTEIPLTSAYVLATLQYLRFEDTGYVLLEEGDQIRIQPEAASTMSAINTFELTRKS